MVGGNRSLKAVSLESVPCSLSLSFTHCVLSAMRQATLLYIMAIPAVMFYLTTQGLKRRTPNCPQMETLEILSPNGCILFKVVLSGILSW